MRSPYRRMLAAALAIALAGCAAPGGTETPGSVEQSAPSVAPATPWTPGESFPIAAFDDIREEPVPEKMAVEFEEALREMAGKGGMSATVMSPDGTWSGATGKADGVRDVRVDDQFAIASVTKPVVAAR
jgi:CubicO group peptidase (beta-lactamase class C family)